MENIKFARDYLTKNSIKMLEDNNNYATQSLNLAIEALEKQIPKKPQIMDTTLVGRFWWYCGHCGASRHTWRKSNYCSYCGGKVDWN